MIDLKDGTYKVVLTGVAEHKETQVPHIIGNILVEDKKEFVTFDCENLVLLRAIARTLYKDDPGTYLYFCMHVIQGSYLPQILSELLVNATLELEVLSDMYKLDNVTMSGEAQMALKKWKEFFDTDIKKFGYKPC